MSVLSRRIFALSVFIAANYFIGIHLRRSYTTGNNSSMIRKTNNDIVALQTQIASKTVSSNFTNDGAPYISSNTQKNISSIKNISSSLSSSNKIPSSYNNAQPFTSNRTNINETETKNASLFIETNTTTIQEDKILRDLLIGFALNYNVTAIYRTVHAFHEKVPGPQQHIALFVNLPEPIRIELTHRFPRVILLDPDQVIDPDMEFMNISISRSRLNPAHRRYAYQTKWLSDHSNQYDRVIMSDIRDIALYSDPFEQLVNITDKGVQVYTEIYKYSEQPHNQRWIRACYGEEYLTRIEDEMVTCCGVIAGTTRALLDYLYAFIKELRVKAGCHDVGTDTAVHVKILHDVLPDVQIVDSDHSLIRHNPSPNREDYEGEIDQTTGGIFNNDGRLYALVHQYDRCPSLIEPYHKRHDISNESEEFKHSVGVKVTQPSQADKKMEVATNKSDAVPDNSAQHKEGVVEDDSTQSRAKCYPLSNNTRLSSTSSMVISTPNTTTNKPFLSGTFVLQTMGEMGNNLAALAYYYAVKTIAYEDFNLNLTLHIRKQNVHKADSAAQNVKCLKSFRDVDFDECNWFQNGKGKICQDKVSNHFKGFKHLARCTDNHTIVELSENLRKTSGSSDGIRSFLKVYVDMLNDPSIMELFREMNIGWTTDEPWPFLCNEGRVHASDQLINEFYSKGLPQFFAFDNETKISSGCCSQFPEKDENVFHYRSFIKDLSRNNFHMHWGGAELRPDNAAKMLLESLPNGSKEPLCRAGLIWTEF